LFVAPITSISSGGQTRLAAGSRAGLFFGRLRMQMKCKFMLWMLPGRGAQ